MVGILGVKLIRSILSMDYLLWQVMGHWNTIRMV